MTPRSRLLAALVGISMSWPPAASTQTVAPKAKAAPLQLAPLANPDILPPRETADASPRLTPHLFLPRDRFGGDGYTPGSTVQNEQERRLRPGAGFNISIPLH